MRRILSHLAIAVVLALLVAGGWGSHRWLDTEAGRRWRDSAE